VPNIFLSTTMTVLALGGCAGCGARMRRSGRDLPSCLCFFRWLIIFAPETYYFRPVDPLIVVLAAYFVTERFGGRSQSEAWAGS